MATISQIKIGQQTYEICDANNRQTTETINNTLTTINQDLTAIKDRFDNGVLKTANGGTALNAANGNALLHALGIAKTAGDTINVGGYRGAGFVTTGRTEFQFSIYTGYLLYGVGTNSYITGAYTVRQNNDYHFGSTASAGYSFTNHHSIKQIYSNGLINIIIDTGAEQARATNNSPAGITLNSGTVNLRS